MKIPKAYPVTVMTAVLLFAPFSLYAHPPAQVKVMAQEKTVTVEVIHKVDPTVSDPKTHYINRITLAVNGVSMVDQRFQKQEGDLQTGVYAIPSLKQGDVIVAEAFCSNYGSLRGETTVGGKRSY